MNGKIRALLERRQMWERLYPAYYIERHFHLYDGELEALLDLARQKGEPMIKHHGKPLPPKKPSPKKPPL